MSNTKLNAIALYANFIVLALIGLVVNPLLVRSLGAEHFGIWKACLRILDLSSVADGRATQALKWIVAHGDKLDNTEQKRRNVGATIAIWLIWLPFLLTMIAILIVALPWLINGIDSSDLSVVRISAGLLGLNIILTALLGIPDAILAGTNQGYRSYVLTTLFLVISNVGMVIAAVEGLGLIGLAMVMVGCQLLNGLFVYFVVRRRVTWWGIARPTVGDVKRIFSFSNLTLVWSLVQTLMLSSEVLLIGYLLSPTDVSRYTFTAYVGQFALSICLMTGSAVTPQLGALIGAGDRVGAAALHYRTRQVLFFILTVVSSGIILLNGTFVRLWVGTDFYMGDVTNIAMVALLVQLAVVRFDAQVQDVGLMIAQKVLWGFIGTITSVGLGATLYAATGELPMLFVGLLIGRLPLNFIFPRLVAKLIPESTSDRRGICAMMTILLLVVTVSRWWQPENWTGLILTGIAGVGLTSVVAFLAIFPKSVRTGFLSGYKYVRRN